MGAFNERDRVLVPLPWAHGHETGTVVRKAANGWPVLVQLDFTPGLRDYPPAECRRLPLELQAAGDPEDGVDAEVDAALCRSLAIALSSTVEGRSTVTRDIKRRLLKKWRQLRGTGGRRRTH